MQLCSGHVTDFSVVLLLFSQTSKVFTENDVILALELAGLGSFKSKVQRKLASYESVKITDLVDIADYVGLTDDGVVRLRKLLTDPSARETAIRELEREKLAAAEASRKQVADAEAARKLEAEARERQRLDAQLRDQQRMERERAMAAPQHDVRTDVSVPLTEWLQALNERFSVYVEAFKLHDTVYWEVDKLSKGAMAVFRKGRVRGAKARLQAADGEKDRLSLEIRRHYNQLPRILGVTSSVRGLLLELVKRVA